MKLHPDIENISIYAPISESRWPSETMPDYEVILFLHFFSNKYGEVNLGAQDPAGKVAVHRYFNAINMERLDVSLENALMIARGLQSESDVFQFLVNYFSFL